MTYNIDAQDLLKMFLHTGVTLIFVILSVTYTVFNINFRGANGQVVPVALMDSEKCHGDCGIADTKVSALESAAALQWVSLALVCLTVITDTGLMPWTTDSRGSRKHFNSITARMWSGLLLLLKWVFLVAVTASYAHFAHDPDAFTVPGHCTADAYKKPDTPTTSDRFLAQALGGILPETVNPPATVDTTNGYNVSSCLADPLVLNTCYTDQVNQFVKNKCKVVDNDVVGSILPRNQIFNTHNVGIELGPGFIFLFFATAITTAQLVTWTADHVMVPKEHRGSYKQRRKYSSVLGG